MVKLSQLKVILLLGFIMCVNGVLFAQKSTQKLPAFYSSKNDDKVFSADMSRGDGSYAYVLYTMEKEDGVYCKFWNGSEWQEHGTFPDLNNRGQVELEEYNNSLYALLQSADGWTMFMKKDFETNWIQFGNSNFCSANTFSNPSIRFVEGKPIVFEQNIKNRTVEFYKYEDGNFLSTQSIAQLTDVSTDIDMISNKDDEMILAWHTHKDWDLIIYRVTYNGTEAELQKLTKGLKVKDVKEIVRLEYLTNQLHLFYLNNSYELQVMILENGKWIEKELPEIVKGLGFCFDDNLSFVTSSRKTDLPVLYQYYNGSWSNGVEIGSTKILHNRPVKLLQGLDDFYVMCFTLEGECVVQEISME